MRNDEAALCHSEPDRGGPSATTCGRGDTLDVFYVSNVEPYLFAADTWRHFYDSVSTLPLSADALFIRSFFGSTAHQCSHLRPSVRTPVIGSIAELIEDRRNGRIETQCALVERSR